MESGDEPGEKSYAIGYGKPPPAHQFKKGQSGNPRGRPKRRDSTAETLKVLDKPVMVRTNGKLRKASLTEVLTGQLRDRALKGDPKAAQEVRELIASFDDIPATETGSKLEENGLHQRRVKTVVDFIQICESLRRLKLVVVNEDGRVKFRIEFFHRLFGSDCESTQDQEIRGLLRSFLMGTPYV